MATENESAAFFAELGLPVSTGEEIQEQTNENGDGGAAASSQGANENNDGGGEGDNKTAASSQQPTTVAAFNFAETFGEGYDQEKVKAELNEFKELKAKYEQLATSPTADFADETVAEFNAYVKNTGNKDYSAFLQLKNASEDLDPIEAMVLKATIQNPEYKGKEEFLRNKLMKDNGLDPNVFDSEEIEFNKIALKDKSKEVFDWLRDNKNKLGITKADPETVKQAKALAETKWLEVANEKIGAKSKLTIPTYQDGKIVPFTEFEIKPELASQYKTAFAKMMSESNYEVNSKNVEVMEQEFNNRFIVNNLPQIMADALQKHENALKIKWEDQYGGPMNKLKEPGSASNRAKDAIDLLLESDF
jgi:hypothetical protein